MRNTKKRALAAMTSAFMMFSLLPVSQTFAAKNTTGTAANTSVTWEARAFGQSTDLNFKSTIAADKVGTNYAKGNQQIKISNDGGKTTETKDAVVVESRGGKIANTHDGLSFYYTKIPTSKNFKLSAKIYLNQLGPEASTGSKTNTQEGCGVMVRDCVGQARKEPMEFGYEELPSASNVVSNWLQAAGKGTKGAINSVIYSRNGVTEPWGNTGVAKGTTKVAALDSNIVTTTDRTPADGIYDASQFFTITLERVDDGFVTTYTNSDGTVTGTQKTNAADRVAVIDGDYMYAGFFASRNAKMTVTDINLTTSDANTKVEGFTPAAYNLSFIRECATATASQEYTVRYFSNYAGKVTVKQAGTELVTDGTVKAGERFEKVTALSTDTTEFEVTFTPDDSSVSARTETFTVTKNEKFANKDLYVTENGTSDAEGTKESPLDLKTAIQYVSDNHTVYVKGGTYDAVAIDATLTASKDKKKSLVGYDTETTPAILGGGTTLAASNWNIKNVHVTGGSSTGFRLSGSGNTIESCKFYKNQDTGCQISGSGDPLTWPKDNYILNCESYSNVDGSRINADGFAAKLGVGTGNVFRGCISHNNADDGWDLFNKIEDGANCPITIDQCIAYENGLLTKEMLGADGVQSVAGSIGNGFKLGGEGLPVNHVVTNCISYNNNMDGFTCNFNPGQITVTNCTSFDNARCNFIFRSNPYRTQEQQGIFTNCVSFRTDNKYETNDFISGTIKNSRFFLNGNDGFNAGDFESFVVPSAWDRNEDGSIKYGDFLRVKRTSKLATSGVNGSYLGAVAPYNVDYKVTFNANGGKCDIASKTYNTGNKVESLPTPTRTGYTFAGWYTAKNEGYKVDAGSLYNAAASETVYAHWIANSYKVTFKANGGFMADKAVTTKTAAVTFDGKYTVAGVATAEKAGYTFKGWYTKKTGGSKVTANTKVATAKDVTLYAQYSKVKVDKSKVSSLKNVKTKKAVVTAKKVSGAAGYEVRYSTKANFKGAKSVTSKTNKNITIKKLSKNTKVYVQVRAFKYDSTGKKVYATWSATSKVTIKK